MSLIEDISLGKNQRFFRDRYGPRNEEVAPRIWLPRPATRPMDPKGDLVHARRRSHPEGRPVTDLRTLVIVGLYRVWYFERHAAPFGFDPFVPRSPICMNGQSTSPASIINSVGTKNCPLPGSSGYSDTHAAWIRQGFLLSYRQSDAADWRAACETQP